MPITSSTAVFERESGISANSGLFEGIRTPPRDTRISAELSQRDTASTIAHKFSNSALAKFAREYSPASAEDVMILVSRIDKIIHHTIPEGACSISGTIHLLNTGEREKNSNGQSVPGSTLIRELCRLAELVSRRFRLRAEDLTEGYYSKAQAAKELNVNERTVREWGSEGLITLPVFFSDGHWRQVILKSVFDRFVSQNLEKISERQLYERLDVKERERIIARAMELRTLDGSLSLYRAASLIATEKGLEPEAVRSILRAANTTKEGKHKIFSADVRDILTDRSREVWDLNMEGKSLGVIARKLECSVAEVRAELRKAQVLLWKTSITWWVPNDFFADPRAEREILHTPEPEGSRQSANFEYKKLPDDYAVHSQSELFSREQEAHLFRKYNYLKYRLINCLRGVDPENISCAKVRELGHDVAEIGELRNRIASANVLLVLWAAKKAFREGQQHSFDDMMRDGHNTLMLAVENFDFSRGNKFSTYLTWALNKNWQRIGCRLYDANLRFREDLRIPLESIEERGIEIDLDSKEAKGELYALISKLEPREQDILLCRFGLKQDSDPQTLDQVGERWGITKERVRQIENKAMRKIRDAAPAWLAEYVFENRGT